jgi:hypothetical protein
MMYDTQYENLPLCFSTGQRFDDLVVFNISLKKEFKGPCSRLESAEIGLVE